MPGSSTVNAAMQKFTQTDYVTSYKHKDVTLARESRDDKDTRSLIDYLHHRGPFLRQSSLQSIATGVIVLSAVNADTAKEVGCRILQPMTGKNLVTSYSKRRTR